MRQLQHDDPAMFDHWPKTYVLPHDMPEIQKLEEEWEEEQDRLASSASSSNKNSKNKGSRQEEERRGGGVFKQPMIYKPNSGNILYKPN
jgi:hypothetical protein